MDSARLKRMKDLFDRAVDLPLSERRAFLEDVCEDPSINADVLAMLDEGSADTSILDREVAYAANEILCSPEIYFFQEFGPYRITRFLGEGGMGMVYLARRDDLGSQVAIKILRDAWMSPARRARFTDEQRMLARLNHPHIARIYDADTLRDGAPWFAMEYIEGVSLTDHCKDLPVSERLRLFRDTCDAVRYAHTHLIVHRDLKPSNILVAKDGTVKLLDFGIAKQLGDGSVPADRTRTALRLMTPDYAAPEQVRGEPAGTPADVYALGVILYELLTGRRPFDLAEHTPAEADRIVLQDEPEKPSTVESRAGKGEFAARTRVEKQSWADLDVLCLTAMHKDPKRRYGSVDAFIRDIDHYSGGRPLDARPDTFRYRLGKFVGRNRRAVAAAALILAATAALVFFFTVRLVAARDEALASAARTERIQRFMLNLFEGGDQEAGPTESLRVVTLLETGAQEAQRLTAEPAIQAELNQTLGGLYHKLGRLDQADALLQTALDRRKSLFGHDHPDVTKSLITLGLLRIDQSRLKDAEQLIREALDGARKMRVRDELRVAEATAALGKVLSAQGSYDKAIPVLEEAVKVMSARPPTPALSEALTDLANTYYQSGRYDAAESLNLQILSTDRQLFGERHPHVAIDLFNLGNVGLDRGNYAVAERHFRESLGIVQNWYGKDHPKAASSSVMLGVALDSQGRIHDAEMLYRQALLIQERVYGAVHPRVGQIVNYLGMNALKQRKLDEAEALFRRAATIFKTAFGDEHEFYAVQLSNIGAVYSARKRYRQAESLLRQAADLLGSALPAGHRYIAITEVRLGGLLTHQNRFREAERHSLAGYQALARHGGSAVPEIRSAREDLVVIYRALNEPDRANSFRAQ